MFGDVFYRHKVELVIFEPHAKEMDYVRVVQAAEQGSFSLEHFLEIIFGEDVGVQAFDSNYPTPTAPDADLEYFSAHTLTNQT